MKHNKRAGILSGVAVIFIIIGLALAILTHVVYEDNQPTELGCHFFDPEFNTSEYRICFTTYWESYCQELSPQDCPDYNPNADKAYNKIK